jgi:hypothetical protein
MLVELGAHLGAHFVREPTRQQLRGRIHDRDLLAGPGEVVATLKHGPFRANPVIGALTDELTAVAGEEFIRRVQDLPGFTRSTGVLCLVRPDTDALTLAYETLELSPDDGLRLLVYLPADAATGAALDRVTRPARSLQLVAG